MIESEKRAREVVMEGVKRLLEEGLVERTWGNISARIDSEYFIITPSGRDYSTMKGSDLVKVKISDLSYEGAIKPSSEKGIHADCYKEREDVNFVIHTHQSYATAVSQSEIAIFDSVPARYAISATKALRKNVREAVIRNPKTNALFLVKHGALFLGEDMDDAFTIALNLEERCKTEVLDKLYDISREAKGQLFSSFREGNSFVIGAKKHNLNESLDFPASLYQMIYNSDSSIKFIEENQSLWVTELSYRGDDLRPVIDDAAQAIGVSVKCIEEGGNVSRAIKNRNALLISGYGALCFASDKDEAKAVSALLEKDALSELYARSENSYKSLGFIDSRLQRFIYKKKYSKLKR